MNRYNYITLLEILNQDAFVPIEGLPVHDTPGWAYAGYCTWVSCFSCSTTGLDIWRKPSENTHYRYWGIFCRDCERLTDLRSYKGSQLASLKEWSKERQPPFTLGSKESDKALLKAYKDGRSISSIANDWGIYHRDLRLRLENFLLFNENYEIPFGKSHLEDGESLEVFLNETWQGCSDLSIAERTELITNAVCDWVQVRGWSPQKEMSVKLLPEICNSGKVERKGRVDVWCEQSAQQKGLAIEIDTFDKAISISKLIQAGLEDYIPIWVRHSSVIEIDVPEQIHLISLLPDQNQTQYKMPNHWT